MVAKGFRGWVWRFGGDRVWMDRGMDFRRQAMRMRALLGERGWVWRMSLMGDRTISGGGGLS